MRVATLRPEFVESIPADLDDGVLYVSISFRTTIHLCACGCRNKTVLPIRPGAWTITYDGEAVSMSPSVGNQEMPCRSHYWIRSSEVRWMHDRRPTHGTPPEHHRTDDLGTAPSTATQSQWARLRSWVTRLLRR